MKRIMMACVGVQILMLAAGCSQLSTQNVASLGSPMDPAQAEFTITIKDSTRYVNVWKFDTVNFVVRAADGRETSFGWRFDTFREPIFSLSEIAPAGSLGSRRVEVYVREKPLSRL